MTLRARLAAAAAAAGIVAAAALAFSQADRIASFFGHAASSGSHGLPAPRGTGPEFVPDAPVAMRAEVRPLGVSPDGEERYLVVARFRDALGAPTELVRGGDVSIEPSALASTDGVRVQWQTRLRFGAPAAIVSMRDPATLRVRVHANAGVALADAEATIAAPARAPAVAAALGPYLVQIGWYPRAPGATVRIARAGAPDVLVDGNASTYRDANVEPDHVYRYRVAVPGRGVERFAVRTPPETADAPLEAFEGNGMWLAFSATPGDADSFDALDPEAIAQRARSAGVHVIELRAAYGPFDEITPQSAGFVDALLDAAATRGFCVVAWTIPRARDFDDLSLAVALARYRTPAGHGFAALAVDLERGADYLGDGAAGYAALSQYLGDLRAALGPHYPLIATVEDANLEHLDDATYPYDAIARSASVMQPMSYWRMLSKNAVTPAAAAEAVRASYAAIARESKRAIRIDVGAQTSADGPRGAPPPAELAAAAREARRLGALGITYFEWRATSDAQWMAIARSAW